MDINKMDITGVDEFTARYIEAVTLVSTGTIQAAGMVRGYKLVNNLNTPYTVLVSDSIIGCDTSSSAITLNLPSCASCTAGFCFKFKDEGGNASTNNITIDPNASETIDGETTFVINTDYDALTIYTNGSNWFIE